MKGIVNILFVVGFLSACNNPIIITKNSILIDESSILFPNINFEVSDMLPDFEGRFTYLISENKLIQVDNKSYNLSEVILPFKGNYHVDLVMGKESMGLLCYDMETAYDIEIKKDILWLEFDNTLNMISHDTLVSDEHTYLVPDRISYVSFYKCENRFFLNDELGNYLEIKNKLWDEKKTKTGYVEMTFGKPVSVQKIDSGRLAVEYMDSSVYIINSLDLSRQFSLNKEKFTFNNQAETIIANLETNEAVGLKRRLNPIRLFKNGYYIIYFDPLCLSLIEIKP